MVGWKQSGGESTNSDKLSIIEYEYYDSSEN